MIIALATILTYLVTGLMVLLLDARATKPGEESIIDTPFRMGLAFLFWPFLLVIVAITLIGMLLYPIVRPNK
jgi:hypothetical protein